MNKNFIDIRIDRLARRKAHARLLHLLAGLYLLLVVSSYLQVRNYQGWPATIPLYLLGLISLLYGLWGRKWDPAGRWHRFLRLGQVIGFLLFGIRSWLAGEQRNGIFLILWAILCTVYLLSEKNMDEPLRLQWSAEGVSLPGVFRPRFYPWPAIEDLVIKPDFVTIHLRKGTYLQYEVTEELTAAECQLLMHTCRRFREERDFSPSDRI